MNSFREYNRLVLLQSAHNVCVCARAMRESILLIFQLYSNVSFFLSAYILLGYKELTIFHRTFGRLFGFCNKSC